MLFATFFTATALSSGTAAAAVEDADIVAALETVESLWLEGRFHDTAEAAATALELIQSSECPLRADVGLVAFMGAVSGYHHTGGWPGGYLYWVATEIHAQFGNLPENALELAEDFRSGPGQSVTTDPYFIGSPYRRSGLRSDCAEPILSADLLDASPEDADHVFIAFRFPGSPGSFHRAPNSIVYAYPKLEGEALGARVIDLGDWYDAGGPIEVRVFAPCAFYPTRGLLYTEVCRDRLIEHP